MNKKVFEYFEDINKRKLKKRYNIIVKDDKVRLETEFEKTDLYRVDDILMHAKKWNAQYTINSIASAQMYNNLGILTPPITLMQNVKGHPSPKNILSIQQDVYSLKQFYCELAADAETEQNIQFDRFDRFKWQVLYDSDIRRIFLKYMTPECLEELISVFLLDELRTDIDRHNSNYFLIKDHNSELFEHVVPIDLDNIIILNRSIASKQSFQDFLLLPYKSVTPTATSDIRHYDGRIYDIKELIQDGALSPKQTQIIKSALKYDLPDSIKKICKKYPLKKYIPSTHEPFARLWEYNRNELLKEL